MLYKLCNFKRYLRIEKKKHKDLSARYELVVHLSQSNLLLIVSHNNQSFQFTQYAAL